LPEIFALIDTGEEIIPGVTRKYKQWIRQVHRSEIYERGQGGMRELFDSIGREHPEARWLHLYMKKPMSWLREFMPWENPYCNGGGE
jgi:hypothetical protein